MTAPGNAVTGRKTYRARPSLWWWTRKRSYTLFALRELSSIFVAWFVVFVLLFVWSVSRGEQQYERFLDVASNPFLVVLNVVALAFLVLHTVTWFNLTPKAMPIRAPSPLGGRRVPSSAIIASQWAGFTLVSAVVIWLVVG